MDFSSHEKRWHWWARETSFHRWQYHTLFEMKYQLSELRIAACFFVLSITFWTEHICILWISTRFHSKLCSNGLRFWIWRLSFLFFVFALRLALKLNILEVLLSLDQLQHQALFIHSSCSLFCLYLISRYRFRNFVKAQKTFMIKYVLLV